MINSQCYQCHYHEKFPYSCLTQASVHGKDLSGTHFLGHVLNINSGTSSGAGFTLFHLMQIGSFKSNSQPFPIAVGISGVPTKHFLQICY